MKKMNFKFLEKKLSLNLISQEREFLFGLAILWIAFFHSSLSVTAPVIHILKNLGNMGVDIFLFLSGLGLYYSLSKDSSPRNFYRKRASRILISYFLVCLPFYLYLDIGQKGDWVQLGLDLSTLSFWLNGYRREWFIAAILVLYLVYPLIYHLFNRYTWKGFMGLLALVLGGSIGLYLVFPTTYAHIEVFLGRIPIFLAGAALAPLIKKGWEFPALWLNMAALGLLLGGYLAFELTYGQVSLHRYLYAPMSLGLTWLLSWLLACLNQQNFLKKFLAFYGGITLELYLVHEKLLTGIDAFWASGNKVFLNLAALLLATLLAWALKKLRDYLDGLMTTAPPTKRDLPLN